jgi:dolichol-phosphate mannosyltransferase
VRALIVLPTYQEAANVAAVLRQVRAAAPDAFVLVVDDGSPDGTAELAREVAAELGCIEVMARPAKAGLGTAYRAGFGWGLRRGFDVLVEMDADLSHDPADVPRLLAAVEGGADMVVGSRYIPGGSAPAWSWHRRTLSRQGNRFAAFMLHLPVVDATSGFRAFRAGVLARVGLDSVHADGYSFQIEMVDRVAAAGGRIAEIPIRFRDREWGRSKMSATIVAEALVLVTWWGVSRRLSRFPDGRAEPVRPLGRTAGQAGGLVAGREVRDLRGIGPRSRSRGSGRQLAAGSPPRALKDSQ